MKQLSPFIRRKYYLNRKMRKVCKVSSRRRTIFIPYAELTGLTGLNKKYFEELVGKYRYMVQYTAIV